MLGIRGIGTRGGGRRMIHQIVYEAHGIVSVIVRSLITGAVPNLESEPARACGFASVRRNDVTDEPSFIHVNSVTDSGDR